MALVTPDEIRAHPANLVVTDAQADLVVRLVEGWLLDATGLAELPAPAASPTPDPLWGAALELAVLSISNPELLASHTVGPTSRAWPAAQQREAILDRVRARYRPGGAANPTGEFGSFPDAECWPDPPMIIPPGWGVVR